jgi:chemotaxis protein histidine kinase CheA
MAAGISDDFQKELVDLFVQEAHEWLQNIHVALDELQQGPAPERHAKLIGTISAGVTNLGGSAATLNLSDVERASFAAIPFVEALRDPRNTFSIQDFLSLCKQLGQIHTALTRATGISFEEDGSRAATEATDVSLSPREFLQALRDLQEQQVSSTVSGRNLICDLIEQMESQVQAGVERIAAKGIQEYLAQVSEAEESFLKAIDERLPEISKKMSALKMDGEEACQVKAAVEASLQDVARLLEEAQRVNEGSAVLFFTGLHSLLTVVAQRRVYLAAARVESVEARLQVMGEAIRQWGEHGRAQHAAIDQLLPASHS